MFDLKIIILRETYTIHCNTVHRITIITFLLLQYSKKKPKYMLHIKIIIIV